MISPYQYSLSYENLCVKIVELMLLNTTWNTKCFYNSWIILNITLHPAEQQPGIPVNLTEPRGFCLSCVFFVCNVCKAWLLL